MSIVLDGTNGITTPDLAVDTNTLFVDAANNLVGVGTDNPTTKLDVVSPTNAGIRVSDGTHTGIMFPSAVGGVVYGTTSNHPAVFFASNAERMRIKADGNVAVGTNAGTSSRLIVGRNGAGSFSTAQLELFSDTGDVILGFHSAGASATCIDHLRATAGVRIVAQDRSVFHPIAASAFNVNSDYRIKENITPLTGAADRLMQLPVHRFSFVEGSMSYQDGITVDGFLAHEAQVVVPEAVTGEKDAVDADGNPILQAIDQSKLVPLLTAALQEALQTIQALEARVAALETPA